MREPARTGGKFSLSLDALPKPEIHDCSYKSETAKNNENAREHYREEGADHGARFLARDIALAPLLYVPLSLTPLKKCAARRGNLFPRHGHDRVPVVNPLFLLFLLAHISPAGRGGKPRSARFRSP